MTIDISAILKSTGIALEGEASRQIGGAVEDFARGVLGLQKPTSFRTELDPKTQIPRSSVWDATSYAAALAGATQYRPKLKFLFKVQFFFSPSIIQQFKFLGENKFTFMIKSVDRPKVDFEYEDDVNIYNYRTKVLKKIRHRELTLIFMDDTGNNVFDFFRTMMLIYSPVTRDSVKRDNQIFEKPATDKFVLGNGMEFSNLSDFQQDDVAHRAVLNESAGQAISLIRVKQIFIDPTTSGENAGTAIGSVYYDFVNPRIVSFDLDDLTHETSDPSMLTMLFDYDWMEMSKNNGIQEDGGPEYFVTVKPLAPSAAIPGQTEGSSSSSGVVADILRDRRSSSELPRGPTPRTDGSTPNPWLNILGNAAGRAVTKVSSDVINKAARTIAGGGKFANSAGGRILTTVAGQVAGSMVGSAAKTVSGAITGPTGHRILGQVSSVPSGIIDAARRDMLGGFFSTVDQSTARAHVPTFTDSAMANNVASVDTSRSLSSSDFYKVSNPVEPTYGTPQAGP